MMRLTLSILATSVALCVGQELKDPNLYAGKDGSGGSGRIVNGTPVEDKATYPFFCRTFPFSCGCTLIAPDIVLSAAHCSHVFSPGGLIKIGGLNKDGDDAEDSVKVEEMIIHPDYHSPSHDNDILLARLERVSTVTEFAAINPDDLLPADGDTVVAIGHGAIFEGGPVSDELLEVAVPVVDFATCNGNPGYSGNIRDDSMLCAGATDIDSCQGDSGGPLFLSSGETLVVVGVTSWGWGCARENLPGVYARVSNYEYFIYSNVCEKTQADELPAYCGNLTPQPTPSPPSPPSNDDCLNAIAVTDGSSTTGETFAANPEQCGGSSQTAGVWYEVQGTGKIVVASTCGSASFDTMIGVVEGCPCQGNFVASNDDFNCFGSSSLRSQVEFRAEAGTTYYILVSGFGSAVGMFELEVTEKDDPPVSPPVSPPTSPPVSPPTSPPVGNPAPAPEPPSCFSMFNTVSVRGKGDVQMDSVRIGDYVQTVDRYSRVISFAHLDPTAEVQFLQIKGAGDKVLEVSREHIVHTTNDGWKRASDLKVGDSLNSLTTIEEIRTVRRKGIISPTTEIGELIVSGVRASSFSVLLDASISPWLQHAATQIYHAPLRLACHWNFNLCKNETYDNHGLSDYVSWAAALVQFLSQLHVGLQVVGIAMLAPVFIAASFVESLVFSPTILCGILSVVATVISRHHLKKPK